MRIPTDEKIRNAAYSLTLAQGGGTDDYRNMEQAIRAALALTEQQVQQVQQVQPEKPNRKGQWFVSRETGMIYGPIMQTTGSRHEIDKGERWLYEDYIANGNWLRILPKLPGMDASECREPLDGEEWYSLGATVVAGNWPVAAHDDFGLNRWIKNKPAKKPWPAGPFRLEATHGSGLFRVWDPDGGPVCEVRTRIAGEALALGLDWAPRAAAAMREAAGRLEYIMDRKPIDALLAELDGWEMPE